MSQQNGNGNAIKAHRLRLAISLWHYVITNLQDYVKCKYRLDCISILIYMGGGDLHLFFRVGMRVITM